MKKLMICICMVCLCIQAFPAEHDPHSKFTNLCGTLSFSYDNIPIKIGSDKISNQLRIPMARLQLNVKLFHRVRLGVILGFHSAFHKEPVDFVNLPLSLRLDQKKTSAMFFGLGLSTEFLHRGNFCFIINTRFLYYRGFNQDWPINLPVIIGSASGDHSFYQFSSDFLIQFTGYNQITLFWGPQLFLMKGTLSFSETIHDLSNSQSMTYRQSMPVGLICGMTYEISNKITAVAQLHFLSKTAFTFGVHYWL